MIYKAIRTTDKLELYRRVVDHIFSGWTPIGVTDEINGVFIRILRKPA